jgi:hypothetical protein
MRARLQLTLPFLDVEPTPSLPRQPRASTPRADGITTSVDPPATSATTTTNATTTNPTTTNATPRPPASKTRLLVDAIVRHQPGARVVFVDTRSTLLSQVDRRTGRVVRVHQMFLDVDDDERDAIGRYLATGCKRAGAVVDAVVRRQGHLLDWVAPPLAPDAHRGRTHDLAVIRDDVNQRYFAGAIHVEIGWSQPGASRRKPRRSITFGTYDHRARRVLVHPCLDEPDVPGLVVERVVHHELLHAHHGESVDERGRRVVHSPAFRADEATFTGAAEADAWLARHLDRLLSWRRPR